ncbi:MAG: hypothetical protein HN742_01665 [Lentisphaerae bacterium]|mgnify:CR=1 FL=1|jgi:hypothetical protein|nr:hypothetical protein [Lentisphaerota bacterium]MBT4814931.1 hypothetical protein [Lentisphaerota bacterium]MBT5611087.1 hypothetical protein [Lentisphaerota bacterium]MBT7061842.1 hypothetical protein [Lentisphaerota bacterium]MBT7840543.1 hypothetical protein [Lentisphaerota bacterium]
MRKSLFYTLFGLGKLPTKMIPILEREGIVVSDEGIRGTITLRKFRAPGRYHWYKKAGFAGSVVVTEARFAAFSFSRPVINVPLSDERLSQLDISVPSEGVLHVSFDAAAFHDDWSGSVECRFRTPHAQTFLEKVQAETPAAANP